MSRPHQKGSKGKDGRQNHKKDHKLNCSSRKAARKANRKKKKEKMNHKYLERFSKTKPTIENLEDITQRKNTGKTLKEHPAHGKKKESMEVIHTNNSKTVLEKKIKAKPVVKKNSVRNKEPVEDAVMARERKQLADLEKKLKMKRSKLPKSFNEDGLDFLLDVVDPTKLYGDVPERNKLYALQQKGEKPPKKAKEKSAKKQGKESSSMDSGSSLKPQKKRVHFQLDEDDEEDASDMEESDEFSDENDDDSEEEMNTGSEQSAEEDEKISEDHEAMSDEEEDSDGESGEEEEQIGDEEEEQEMEDEEDGDDGDDGDTEKVREDIYGRLVDSKGNLISNKEQSGAYIPPAKRAAMLAKGGQDNQELDLLKKQMKGLLNRASESNMQGIANSVEDLFMRHSRAAVNQSLFSLVQEAVVSPVLAPVRLVAEMVMLVAILHGNVGSEVGAYVLQHTVKQYEELRHHENYGGEHIMDNVVLMMCYLYNFKIAHHALLFEMMSQFVESFTEKDIELLLLVLKCAGFYLRRDDPESLGQQIASIQQKARGGLGEGSGEGSAVPARVRFMLEVLVAVRNNNIRRVPGADTERTDRLRQLAGKFIRGGSLADNQLNIGLQDLLQADHKGRWWIVGSAWEGRQELDPLKATKSSGVPSVVGAVNPKLAHLAKKLRINSDLRRSIFYVLMSSEDYEDAFQKVLHLGLKGQQQQEIVVVAVLCCKHQSSFNPFYSLFLQKLATHERKFMIAIQFHMWDQFKTVEDLTPSSRQNLAAMLAHLLASKALSLSVLKVLEFGLLSKATVKFLKRVFITLLSKASASDLQDMCRIVAQAVKLRPLVDGLRTFLVKHVNVEDKDQKNKLLEMCNQLATNHSMLL